MTRARIAAPRVYEAIVAITAELAGTGIAKTQLNRHEGYAYRGIDDVVKALAAPDVKKRLIEAGIVATSSSPEGFTAYVKAESAKWAKVIKDAGISVE